MTEKELQAYLRTAYPKENIGCEWKAFSNLNHTISGRKGEDAISYVSALANMEGGQLVMGVEDETLQITGIQDTKDYTPENLPFRLRGNCPNLSSEGLRVEAFITSDTNKTVWVLHVPKHLARLPVYAHNTKWQRIGDSLKEMTKERELVILNEPLDTGYDWSAEVVDGANLSDLAPEAIAFAREKYGERYRNAAEVSQWDDVTFLNKAYLTKQGKITRTAILLLGKPESKHFIEPAFPLITWVLRDAANMELGYEHFHPPFLLASDKIYAKIRNLKYVYLQDHTLFPTEVDMYDPFLIRETLHNCIAHQDYELGRKVNVVEFPNELVFTNAGSFLPGSVEQVIERDSPPDRYRNPFLATAMTNLNMIEIRGGGIKKMFNIQKQRFFPMPDYDFSDPDTVKVKIFGKIIDENYTKLLINRADLDLRTVILLDWVQKGKSNLLTEKQIRDLKLEKLIEGRKPNYFVSAFVADITDQRATYIKNRGIDDQYCKKLISDYLKQFKSGHRGDFETLLFDKLPDFLTPRQKKNKVKNLLQAMRLEGIINLKGKNWFLI
jgi:ATP-dependent DNA helicase RecG